MICELTGGIVGGARKHNVDEDLTICQTVLLLYSLAHHCTARAGSALVSVNIGTGVVVGVVGVVGFKVGYVFEVVVVGLVVGCGCGCSGWLWLWWCIG